MSLLRWKGEKRGRGTGAPAARSEQEKAGRQRCGREVGGIVQGVESSGRGFDKGGAGGQDVCAMKKIFRILFDTAWGAPALFGFVLVLGDLRSIFAAPLSHCGTVLFLLDVALDVLTVLAGLVLLVAP